MWHRALSSSWTGQALLKSTSQTANTSGFQIFMEGFICEPYITFYLTINPYLFRFSFAMVLKTAEMVFIRENNVKILMSFVSLSVDMI